jgi:hypothetical protein
MNMENDEYTETSRRATTMEIVRVSEQLKQVLVDTGDVDKLGRPIKKYLDGWSDDRIADEIGNAFPRSSVRRIRQQVYGKIRGAVKPEKEEILPPIQQINRKLAKLQSQIEYLAGQLGVKFPM